MGEFCENCGNDYSDSGNIIFPCLKSKDCSDYYYCATCWDNLFDKVPRLYTEKVYTKDGILIEKELFEMISEPVNCNCCDEPLNEITDTTRFYDACKNGDLDTVKSLYIEDKDNYEDGIRISCEHGQLEIVKYLLEQPNFRKNVHFIPGLSEACINGHIEIIKFLSEYEYKGIKPNFNAGLYTVLYAGVHNDNFDITNFEQRLNILGPKCTKIALNYCLSTLIVKKKYTIEILSKLISYGANDWSSQHPDEYYNDRNYENALYYAYLYNDEELINLIQNSGLNNSNSKPAQIKGILAGGHTNKFHMIGDLGSRFVDTFSYIKFASNIDGFKFLFDKISQQNIEVSNWDNILYHVIKKNGNVECIDYFFTNYESIIDKRYIIRNIEHMEIERQLYYTNKYIKNGPFSTVIKFHIDKLNEKYLTFCECQTKLNDNILTIIRKFLLGDIVVSVSGLEKLRAVTHT